MSPQEFESLGVIIAAKRKELADLGVAARHANADAIAARDAARADLKVLVDREWGRICARLADGGEPR